MNFEDFNPCVLRREINSNLPVEPAGPQQRLIENIGAVRGGHNNHIFTRFKTI
jgi:hypothetical protein